MESGVEVGIKAESGYPLVTGSDGVELRCIGGLVISPRQRRTITTQVTAAIPVGYEGHTRISSELSLNTGIVLLDPPGVISSEYIGVIILYVVNTGEDDVTIEDGDYIGQLTVVPLPKITWKKVQELSS